MKTILKNVKFLALFMSLALFIQGCTEDDDADGVEMIEAGFTYTLDEDTGVVNFLNTSQNADDYSWDFGDQSTSTEINPTHVYETGTYTVVLTATNAAGASATFEDEITINIPLQITVPFNFDDANTIYDATVFNGASYEVVANPAPGGSNDVASNVGAITNSGAAFEGIFFDLGAPVDLANDMTIQMDVWSDQALPVLLKLEQGTGPDTEIAVNHSGNDWENLIFTFASESAYRQMTLFIDGPGTTAGTFYIDNVRQTSTVDTTPPVITLNGDATITITAGDSFTDPGAMATDNLDDDAALTENIVVGGDTVDTNTPGTYVITYNVMDEAGNAAAEVTRTVIVEPCSDTNNLELGIDFDCPTIDYAGKIVGNVNFMVVENPDQSGANAMETMVGQITNAGAMWENAFFNLDTPVDFSTDKGIKLKLWSDQAVPVLLKFEDGTEDPVEVSADHGGTGWEELSFTFTSTGSYNDMVIFVDGPGTTAGTFYVDHIEQFAGDGGGGGEPSESPYCQTEVYHLGIPAETASAVLLSIFNVDEQTMRIEIESANDDPVDLLVLPAGDFNPVPGISMAPADIGGGVWAAEFIYPDGAPENAELYLLWSKVSSAGNWQLGGPGADLLSVPFNATCDTGGGGGGECTETMLTIPIDFDCEGIDYPSKQTGDIGFSLVDNPDPSGANPTVTKVAETVWDNNQVWENMFFTLDSPLDFSAGSTITMKMWSDSPQPVLLKFEQGVGGAGNIELSANHGGTGWEELSFPFSSTDAYSAMVIFVNGGGETTGTFYFDDIAQTADGGGGGGGGTLLTLPADFENGETFSKTFEGGVIGSNAPNPDPSGINTSGNVYRFEKPAGTEWYGGMENDFDPLGLTSGEDVVIRVKIYPTKGNVPVQLQLNRNPTEGGQPNYSNVQTSGPANTWTELTFTITAPTFDNPDLYDTIVIIPDWDNTNEPTSTTEIYYIDDIVLE